MMLVNKWNKIRLYIHDQLILSKSERQFSGQRRVFKKLLLKQLAYAKLAMQEKPPQHLIYAWNHIQKTIQNESYT